MGNAVLQRQSQSPGNIHQGANCCHPTWARLPRVLRGQQAEFLSLNLTSVFWGSDCSSYLGERPTEVNKRWGWARISAPARINIHTAGSKPTVCLILKDKLERFQFPPVMGMTNMEYKLLMVRMGGWSRLVGRKEPAPGEFCQVIWCPSEDVNGP